MSTSLQKSSGSKCKQTHGRAYGTGSGSNDGVSGGSSGRSIMAHGTDTYGGRGGGRGGSRSTNADGRGGRLGGRDALSDGAGAVGDGQGGGRLDGVSLLVESKNGGLGAVSSQLGDDLGGVGNSRDRGSGNGGRAGGDGAGGRSYQASLRVEGLLIQSQSLRILSTAS